MKILKILKIILSCKQIYGPWIVSSGKKSNTTTIVSDRQRIWSDHIFLFHTFVTQTFERLLGLFFSFVKKWKFWKSWKSFRDVSKFYLLNYCISYVTLDFQNHIKIFVISNNLFVLSLNIPICKDTGNYESREHGLTVTGIKYSPPYVHSIEHPIHHFFGHGYVK